MTRAQLLHLGTAAMFSRQGVPTNRQRSSGQRSRAANLNLAFEEAVRNHHDAQAAGAAWAHARELRERLGRRFGYRSW